MTKDSFDREYMYVDTMVSEGMTYHIFECVGFNSDYIAMLSVYTTEPTDPIYYKYISRESYLEYLHSEESDEVSHFLNETGVMKFYY